MPSLPVQTFALAQQQHPNSASSFNMEFFGREFTYVELLLIVAFVRYYRLVVHLFAYLFLYKATPIPSNPKYTSDNVHVIIPTVEPENQDFLRCIESCLRQKPAFLTVVTSSQAITERAKKVLTKYVSDEVAEAGTKISVTTGPMANKRAQVTHVLDLMAAEREKNENIICVMVDDHVWWPSENFLASLLAPFENEKVGIVGTNKEVQRERGSTFAQSFLNFIACLYLERHNFEITSANAIDGGVFVISGRTCAIRASIVMNDDFRAGFKNEYFFFGMFGPLNPDDDNYITRYIVRNGWDIKIQNCKEATICTTLGTIGGYKKFRGQLLRWARSQWRSNACSVITDGSVWYRQLWCVHAVFIASFYNLALVFDPALLYLSYRVSMSTGDSQLLLVKLMAVIILLTKTIKLAPFFKRNPQDIWMFPLYVLFAYLHSFIKVWSLITFWDHSWGGRNLKALSGDDKVAVKPKNILTLEHAEKLSGSGSKMLLSRLDTDHKPVLSPLTTHSFMRMMEVKAASA